MRRWCRQVVELPGAVDLLSLLTKAKVPYAIVNQWE